MPYNANVPNGVPEGSGVELRQLEMRINVAERSNRALLEEVVRLQSELKTQGRQAEEKIQDERNSRKQMENSLRSSNDLIMQLTARLQVGLCVGLVGVGGLAWVQRADEKWAPTV